MNTKLFRHLVVCFTIASVASVTLAQSNDATIAKAKNLISKAERYMKKVQEKMDGAKDVIRDSDIKIILRETEKSQEELNEAKKLLSGISTPESQEQLKRIQSVEAQIKNAIEFANKQSEANDSAKSLGTSEAAAQDAIVLEAIEDQFERYKFIIQGPARDYQESLESFPHAEKEFLALKKKYAPVLSRPTSEVKEIVYAIKRADVQYKKITEGYQPAMRSQIDFVTSRMAELEETVRTNIIPKQNFGGYHSYVKGPLDSIAMRIDIYNIAFKSQPGFNPKFKEEINNRIQAIHASINTLAAQVIKSNTPPADVYSGADKGTLISAVKTLWNAKYPQDKVIAVRLPDSSWFRRTGYKWDDIDKAWKKIDYSTIDVAVIIDPSQDGNYWIYHMEVTKSHLQNNRLSLTGYKPDGKPRSPFNILPKANF